MIRMSPVGASRLGPWPLDAARPSPPPAPESTSRPPCETWTIVPAACRNPPGTHEPIITPEQAHLAERAAHRRHRPGRYGRTGRIYPLAWLACCGCGLRMRGETLTRPGRDPEWRYYRCPGRRDGRCSSSNTPADVVEAFVVEHLATSASPPGLVEAMRAELGRLRHLPGEELSGQRGRVEQAMKRLGDRYSGASSTRPSTGPSADSSRLSLPSCRHRPTRTSSPSIARR